ncbi:MAG: PqqD family protein [Bdellovibrionaceae bacterium]|nr:PqqD family protein [Pseudobdellovibrionaceae bacterium]
MSWKQQSDVVTQENKDGSFLLHMQTGVYFGLDTVANEIWLQLKEPQNIESLTNYLVDQYQITKDQARTDSLEFISELENNNLVVEL